MQVMGPWGASAEVGEGEYELNWWLIPQHGLEPMLTCFPH